MFDVLVYLYENYWRPDACPDHDQLTLFVSPQGRGVLFQQHRLAAFLQAGLLVPAQDEALTVRATRSAMAKLDGDPSRLLG